MANQALTSNDVLCKVFSNLRFDELLLSAALVSPRWRKASRDESLWQLLLATRWQIELPRLRELGKPAGHASRRWLDEFRELEQQSRRRLVARFTRGGHRDEALFVAFSHDGRSLASCSKDGFAIIWNIERNASSTSAFSSSASASGKDAKADSKDSRDSKQSSPFALSVRHKVPLDGQGTYLAWSGDDALLHVSIRPSSGLEYGLTSIFNAHNGSLVCKIPSKPNDTNSTFLPDGAHFVTPTMPRRLLQRFHCWKVSVGLPSWAHNVGFAELPWTLPLPASEQSTPDSVASSSSSSSSTATANTATHTAGTAQTLTAAAVAPSGSTSIEVKQIKACDPQRTPMSKQLFMLYQTSDLLSQCNILKFVEIARPPYPVPTERVVAAVTAVAAAAVDSSSSAAAPAEPSNKRSRLSADNAAPAASAPASASSGKDTKDSKAPAAAAAVATQSKSIVDFTLPAGVALSRGDRLQLSVNLTAEDTDEEEEEHETADEADDIDLGLPDVGGEEGDGEAEDDDEEEQIFEFDAVGAAAAAAETGVSSIASLVPDAAAASSSNSTAANTNAETKSTVAADAPASGATASGDAGDSDAPPAESQRAHPFPIRSRCYRLESTGAVQQTEIVRELELRLDAAVRRMLSWSLSSDQRYLLMNVRPFTVDFDPNQPAKTAELHASKGVVTFQMSYGEQREIVLDALPISDDVELRMYDLATPELKLVAVFKGHRAFTPANSAFFLHPHIGGPDNLYLATGGEDKLLHVWHRHYGVSLARLPGHRNVVNAVSFSPRHPNLLASASDDYSVALWHAPG